MTREDDRPPICPACGVTVGIIVGDDGRTRDVCLECGFIDESASLACTRGARKAEIDIALSNAMGLGGHNGCLLLGRVE